MNRLSANVDRGLISGMGDEIPCYFWTSLVSSSVSNIVIVDGEY
jgi:hypothetical protein